MIAAAVLASVAEARVRVLPALEPAWPGAACSGPAFTVQGAPGDNLALHHAIAAAAKALLAEVARLGERERAVLAEVECGRTTVEIYGYGPL